MVCARARGGADDARRSRSGCIDRRRNGSNRSMILGVNGIRLVARISGVARATEALLNAFAEIDHPFDDVRVYSPESIDPRLKLPASVRNVVVRSALSGALWEQLVLPHVHGSRD